MPLQLNGAIEISSGFNIIPDSLLSRVFVLAQNPKVALVNKKAYYVSQEPYTISEYIYRHIGSTKQNEVYTGLYRIFGKYPRIKAIEPVGILLIRKMKGIKYEDLLELALESNWKNVVLRLFAMYIVVDRETSKVVHANTTFMNKHESLSIDIEGISDIENTMSRDFTDTVISEELCLRPLINTRRASEIMVENLLGLNNKAGIEGLISLCRWTFEVQSGIPIDVKGSFSHVGNKTMLFYLLLSSRMICFTGDFEKLKEISEIDIDFEIRLEELILFKRLGYSGVWDFVEYVEKQGYYSNMDQLLKQASLFYSIMYKKRKFLEYFRNGSVCGISGQKIFDTSVYLNKGNFAKEVLVDVELNSVNIEKVMRMAYKTNNVGLIRYVMDNKELLRGELDENVLQAVIKNKEYELAKRVLQDYPKTATMTSLLGAIRAGSVELVQQIIDVGGLKVADSGFKGLRMACDHKNIEMIMLLMENGASVCGQEKYLLTGVCTNNIYEIMQHILSVSYRIDKNQNGYIQDKKDKGQKACVDKVLEHLVVYGLGLDRDVYVRLTHYLAAKDVESIKLLLENVHWGYDDFINRVMRKCRKKIMEIVEFVIRNEIVEQDEVGVNKKRKTKRRKKKDNEFRVGVDDIQRSSKYSQQKLKGKLACFQVGEIFDDIKLVEMNSELRRRDLEILRVLIENGVQVNTQNSLVLRTAYKSGDIYWIDYFICKKGAELGVAKYNGLKEACESGRVEVLKHWMNQTRGKKQDNKQDKEEYNGIKSACLVGNLEMVKLLVQLGCDLSDPNCNGVLESCMFGDILIVKYLIDNGATLGKLQLSGLNNACLTGNVELVKLLLDNNIDLKSPEFNGIKHACMANSLQIVSLLLQAGAKLEYDSGYCITLAITYNNPQLACLLLDHAGVINNSDLLAAINAAIRINNVDLVNLLLQYQPQIYRNCDVLFQAVKANNLEIVKLLLLYSVTLGQQHYFNSNSNTNTNTNTNTNININSLISEACKNNNLEMAILLHDHGAVIQRGSNCGVIQACKNNNIPLVSFLLSVSPNLIVNTNFGVYEAFLHRNVDMLKLLLRHGVNINSHNGLPLKLAFKLNCLDLVQFLLSLHHNHNNNHDSNHSLQNSDLKCSKNFIRKIKRFSTKNNLNNQTKIDSKTKKRLFISQLILDSLSF